MLPDAHQTALMAAAAAPPRSVQYDGAVHCTGTLQTEAAPLSFEAEAGHTPRAGCLEDASPDTVWRALKKPGPLPRAFRENARSLVRAALSATFETLPDVLRVRGACRPCAMWPEACVQWGCFERHGQR